MALILTYYEYYNDEMKIEAQNKYRYRRGVSRARFRQAADGKAVVDPPLNVNGVNPAPRHRDPPGRGASQRLL